MDEHFARSASNKCFRCKGKVCSCAAPALSHQAMLNLLRDAFANGSNVVINAEIPTGKNNGILSRAWSRAETRPLSCNRHAALGAAIQL